MNTTAQARRVAHADWKAEAVRRFGPVSLKWRFVCPVCGHVAATEDWMKVGAEEGEVAFSCVGRHLPGSKQAFEQKGDGPCTYAGGGLIKVNPVTVFMPDGVEHKVFEFADAEASPTTGGS